MHSEVLGLGLQHINLRGHDSVRNRLHDITLGPALLPELGKQERDEAEGLLDIPIHQLLLKQDKFS